MPKATQTMVFFNLKGKISAFLPPGLGGKCVKVKTWLNRKLKCSIVTDGETNIKFFGTYQVEIHITMRVLRKSADISHCKHQIFQ